MVHTFFYCNYPGRAQVIQESSGLPPTSSEHIYLASERWYVYGDEMEPLNNGPHLMAVHL